MPEGGRPTESEIHYAARQLAEGRPEAAIAVLERLTLALPAYVAAHVLLARAYALAGRQAEALQAWHRAYFLMPNSPLIARQRQRLLQEIAAAETGDTFWPEGRTAPQANPHDLAPPIAEGDEPEWVGDGDGPDATPEAQIDWPEAQQDPTEPAAWLPEDDDRTGRQRAAQAGQGARSDDGAIEAEIAPPRAHPSGPSSPEPLSPPTAEPWPDLDDEDGPPVERNRAEERGLLEDSPDLDTLIARLEQAPPIRPQASPPPETPPAEFDDEVTTVTLAWIYEAQQQFGAAARAYERLADDHPARADEFRQKAAEMRRRAEG